ncbi:MAG: prepilin-type N-terminal cleavage/methylation domain-containing protein [Phycisphaerae bacterium]|nr:prepilin-type N-terminal cleavage/methylation domain-containing protein [Phycisphaerae bacterium]
MTESGLTTRGEKRRVPPRQRGPLAAHNTRAFSLAELMIAIAILGMGLLLVASMFPIAWGKARDLSEYTTAISCAETASVTVKLLTRVDSPEESDLSPDPPIINNYTSFAGDYVVETGNDNAIAIAIAYSDTFVHFLTTENMLTTIPSASDPEVIIPDEGWRLMNVRIPEKSYDLSEDPDLEKYLGQWYDTPQVLLHQRVFPAMDPYPDPDVVPPPDDRIDTWLERLGARRFCWAVFHRSNEAIQHPQVDDSDPHPWAKFVKQRRAAACKSRLFTMYYVTLRRGKGQRFIRQDAAAMEKLNAIKALSHEPDEPNDVRLPSPWLVPIKTPNPDINNPANRCLNFRVPSNPPPAAAMANRSDVVPRGVPSEVLVEVNAASEDYREFFPPGTQFIDSINGNVYKVAKRRMKDDGFDDDRFDDDPSATQEAILTLDCEIYMEGLFDPRIDTHTGNQKPGTVPVAERYVWVFPPAIERIDKDAWVVQGSSPVVAIHSR